MESKKDLIKIGQEGFALLDEYDCRNRRLYAPAKNNSFPSQRSQIFLYQFQPQKPNVYHMNPVSRTEKTIIRKHEAKPDLVKIGLEGFALMDEYYGKRPGSSSVHQNSQFQPEKPQVYQVKPAYATEKKVMNAYEAAKLHGGMLLINRSK